MVKMRERGITSCFFVGILILLAISAPFADELDRFDTIVIDAGHGGEDTGARGPSGLLEKDVALSLTHLLEKRLRKEGLRVFLTRADDRYVPLELRTSIANDAHADLFLSIHANASTRHEVSGVETFFLALDASDHSAQEVADAENGAFRTAEQRAPVPEDPLFHILGDLIETETLMESSELAGLLEKHLGTLRRGHSRGVKQAPFVVLMGVQTPASLVEVGFITNAQEEKNLRKKAYQEKIVDALVAAVHEFGLRYDTRRGVAGEKKQL